RAPLGSGKHSHRQVLTKLAPDQVSEAEPEPAKSAQQTPAETKAEQQGQQSGAQYAAKQDTGDLVIKVKGIDDLLVYRAKCCNPIRGESIVGYVTRGK